MEIIFWGGVSFVIYVYAGYLLLVGTVARFRNRPIRKQDITPTVSFIITARNEERAIGQKILNTLSQDYPRKQLEVIVVSDGSTDRTDDTIKTFETHGVRLVKSTAGKGKEAAQEIAVAESVGEILVFSDVAIRVDVDFMRNIVKNFADPTVGAVSSVDRLIEKDGTVSGEGAYLRYEMLLRDWETGANSIVGVTGGCFAVRREVLCRGWSWDLQSDFQAALASVRLGLRAVSDPSAICYYNNIVNERKEFDRKVRTVLRGLTVLMRNADMLNPLRYGIFAWQLMSHKLCRWLVPFVMLTTLLANLFLVEQSPFYAASFLMQLTLYAMTAMWCCTSGIWRRVLKVPAFLVLTNVSVLYGWLKYLRGDRIVSWQSSSR